MVKQYNIALAGNPNSGKSSLFNMLTGLNQKVGNYPGITIDKKFGSMRLKDGAKCNVFDLPGAYSIYPKSEEEKVVRDVLCDSNNPDYPDLVIVVADATNLKRNLLLFTQIHDLGIPVILALNLIDVVKRRGKDVDIDLLAQNLQVPIVPISARSGEGIDHLKEAIEGKFVISKPYYTTSEIELKGSYAEYIKDLNSENGQSLNGLVRAEVLERYKFLDKNLTNIVQQKGKVHNPFTKKLDKVLTHRVFGYAVMLLIMAFIFQAIFKWAEYPMNFIDASFSWFSTNLKGVMPEGIASDLIAEGVIPGIAGIIIFIPQIAILFAFIAILEETGYMTRVVFLMDRVMRVFGLNGRSVVPLVSGIACAVPAIMSSRAIPSKKERIITILVTPLMSCSARLPVYTILIALVIPATSFLGIIDYQGLVLLGLYFLGFFAALIVGTIMSFFVKMPDPGFFVMEMPSYKIPRWRNVFIAIYEKTKTFVWEAGRIIFAISIILWFMASYGPGQKMDEALSLAEKEATEQQMAPDEKEKYVASVKLEHSFAGIFGKAIEPAIEPLGYDWKIGIALVSSFAAREVFVGTMATIYSIGNTDDEATVKERMSREVNTETGGPRFTLAVGVSLMLFYAFAMQCMSTIAVVYRETKGWKWPLVQVGYMTALAYVSALMAYQLLK